jgi:3'-phosphoadenosine 5'-phosphosulfate sulfotransferase (PAPS reductase)/FAD synthetase
MSEDNRCVNKREVLYDILNKLPKNKIVIDNFIKAFWIINNDVYKKIICTVSGGADSDVMMDICTKCDVDNKIDYVWFDTGLEYQATKDHLLYLEEKYNIDIIRYRAVKSIPLSCRQYGQPFLSKQISEFIQRLQRHNFKFEDKSFEELYAEYPKCKSALQWWCNRNRSYSLNISGRKWLKEFLVENPPTFNISNKCCKFAKKDVAHKAISENQYDLNIYGVRKSEGGARAQAYKNCFDQNDNNFDNYRPLFYYKDADRVEYELTFDIVHSKCYTEYGLDRTGCAGCPFGKNFEFELEVIEKFEPKLFKAANKIFNDSYEYTRMYREFREKMDKQSKLCKQQSKE